jgi:hypothetical protein
MPVFILIAIFAMIGLRYGVGKSPSSLLPHPPSSCPLVLFKYSRLYRLIFFAQTFGNARAKNLSF